MALDGASKNSDNRLLLQWCYCINIAELYKMP